MRFIAVERNSGVSSDRLNKKLDTGGVQINPNCHSAYAMLFDEKSGFICSADTVDLLIKKQHRDGYHTTSVVSYGEIYNRPQSFFPKWNDKVKITVDGKECFISKESFKAVHEIVFGK